MNVPRLWSIACAEMRSCRRLARTWVITVIALICGSIAWLYLSLAHMFASYVSASAGLTGPHFAILHIGRLALLSFTVGIVFLAFDIRQRDVRERIGESIDVRPMSNFELITGRLFGVVLLLAIPVVTLITLMCVYGIIAEIFNFGFGSAIDPISVAAFLVWDVAPNLLFWGALTMLIAVLVRYRAVTVLIMLLLLLGYYYLSSRIPFYLAAALSTYTGSDSLPSALAPQFFNADVVFNRIYVMVLTAGLLGITSAVYPRQANLQERQIFVVTGCAAVVIATFGIYALVNSKLQELEQIDHWASIHKQFQTHSESDIEAISGNVEIFPGRSINLDLVLSLTTSPSGSAEAWIFSLNPGYKIVGIELNGEKNLDYEFVNGLLTIPKNGVGSSRVEIKLVAKGVPDPTFAYLDSSLMWKDLNYTEALAARRFGTKSYIFHPQIVALVPGVSWFPSAGAAYGQTKWETRPQDFYNIDIQVSVPKGWIVAGPGSRALVADDKRTQYRFNPTNPVSEVALVGSRFERRALSVEGTAFELLLSNKHTKNLAILESVVPALKTWIKERVAKANELGLSYPYDTLSFVEVPHSLRTYGGGWRMDSVFSPPGIQMFRESGLPIARFDYVINSQVAELTEDEEKLGAFVLQLLQDFFENDFEGGNPFQNLGRNLISHQTKPKGTGATAMEYFVGELANKLVLEVDGYFLIHSALEGNRASELTNSLIYEGGGFGMTPSIAKLEWRRLFTNRPSVWEHASNTALSNLNFEEDAMNSFHALLLKTNANTRLIMDVSDGNDIGSFLRDLVAQYGGTNYSETDLYNTALNAGLDLSDLLGNWLHSTEAPGFVVGRSKLERLENPELEDSLYQTSFLVRNDEPIDGYITVSYGDVGKLGIQKLNPLRVQANTTLQLAIQTIDHPGQVSVNPYFSLNRKALLMNFIDQHDDNTSKTPEMLPYVSEVDWNPHAKDSLSIIVDDLDAEFSVIGGKDADNRRLLPKWFTYLFGDYDTVLETDQGLLQFKDASESLSKDPFNSVLWYRNTEPSSFGKYRHTYVLCFQQTEHTQATFSAEIPNSGRWKLELHMPDIKWKYYRSIHSPGFGSINHYRRPFKLALLQLEVKNLGLSKTLEFDAQEANTGWIDLGIFDLDLGTVDVVITPKTEGNIVGDAIRWTLAREEN